LDRLFDLSEGTYDVRSEALSKVGSEVRKWLLTNACKGYWLNKLGNSYGNKYHASIGARQTGY
jgi:hypothetical protein